MGMYFNGEIITVPGVYSTVDTTRMATKQNNGDSKVIALIGECEGGEPETVQFFSNPVDAKKILKGGELLKACNKAWNPVSKTKEGVALGGANIIACIRTNRATKGTLNVNDGQLVFESKDWNSDANQIEVKLGDGTLSGTKKLTVHNQATGIYENFDNLGGVFEILYTGTQAYAELNILKSGTDIKLQTKVGANKAGATVDLDMTLDTTVLKSMNALIQKLQAYENYKVTISSSFNGKIKVTELDLVEAADIKTAYNVTAVYRDIQLKLINSNMIALTTVDTSKGEIDNFDYELLTGGTDGTTDASWIKYFDMLSNLDISYIVPLTGDISIQSELAAHVADMSGTKGKERRMICGGDSEETIQDTIKRAKTLASDRVQVVHGGFFDYNAANELELYPPYILAAQHAGRVAFLEDGESATHDCYIMAAPEYKLEKSEIEALLEAGCLAFEFVMGRNSILNSSVRLVHDMTTDVDANDTVHTERAVGDLADSINKEIRQRLDSLLTGKRTSTSDLTTAKNEVLSILFNRKAKNHIVDYKDVYVTKTGTVTTIDYSVAPSEPNNFTLITAHYYSEVISV